MSLSVKRIFYSSIVPFLMIFLMALIKFVEYFLEKDFAFLGVFPLKINGLIGILTSPFVHGSFEHLTSNISPFLFLGTGLFYFYPRISWKIFLGIWFCEGLCLWLGGRPSFHIGASGIVYGLAGFLLTAGILSKQRKLWAISLLVMFWYGGMFWGILPLKEQISWEAHFFGLISGIAFAFFYRKQLIFKPKILLFNEEFSQFSTTHGKFSIRYFYIKKLKN